MLKPKGALLIRELRRPSRLQMQRKIQGYTSLYGERLRPHVERAMRAAFTRSELETLVRASGLERVQISETDEHHLFIERPGESDPNSWIKTREQYM